MPSDPPRPVRYASLFRDGGNQAVHFPQGFEMAGDWVRILRDGNRLILEPVVGPRLPRRLSSVLAELGPMDEEFPDVDAGVPPPEDS